MNFTDGNHALVTGMITGALMKAELDATPVIDLENDYRPEISVRIGGQHYLLTVEAIGDHT